MNYRDKEREVFVPVTKRKFKCHKLERVAAFMLCVLLLGCAFFGCSGDAFGSTTDPESTPAVIEPESSGEATTAPSDITTALDEGTTAGSVAETENVTDEATLTEEPDPVMETKRLSFAACGDNILYRPAIREAATRAVEGGRKYNFRPIYKNVEDIIADADIAFINQETVIAGEEYGYSGYPTFNSPCDIADDLVDIGFDVVSLANNHILDMWEAGLLNTLNYWRELPVATVGAYINAEDASELRIVERDGVKVAFLAYTYGANGRRLGSDSELVISFYREQDPYSANYGEIFKEKLISEVSAAKAAADVVVVSIHWGREDTQVITDEQRELAVLLCDAGADVILGHHPHVLQSMEYIQSTNGDRTAFCAYSLGNFLGMQGYDHNALGGILTFELCVDADGVRVENVEFIPTVSYFNVNYLENEIYLFSEFTDELCASHCVVRRGGDGTFGGRMSMASLTKILKNAIKVDFLPDALKSLY